MSARKPGSPRIKVVEHRPVRRAIVICGGAVTVVIALVVGFALGQSRAVSERGAASLLNRNLSEVETELADLTARVIDAELNVTVHKEAAQALRRDISAMHDKNASLAEELTFYKSLMAPSSLPQGLQIAELAIEPGAQDAHFEYQLLLTQIAKRRSYISGGVRVDVIGRRGDDEAVLSLTELAEVDKYPVPFRFRYFQDIAGVLELPADFVPQKVLVTATQKGSEPLQASFEWQISPGSGSG